MDPSSIRNAAFYGAQFKRLTRGLIMFIGASVAALCALMGAHFGFAMTAPLARWSCFFGGITLGLLICRVAGQLQSQHALRIFWTGIEVNRFFKVRVYSFSDIVKVSSDGTIKTTQNTIELFAGLFAPKRSRSITDELVRRFDAREGTKRLQAVIKHPGEGGDTTVMRPWQLMDWPVYRRIMVEPSIRTAHQYGLPSRALLREWFLSACDSPHSQALMRWSFAIEDRSKDISMVGGHLDVWLTDPVSGIVEIAFGILPNARRRGHCRRGIEWMISVVSELEGIRAIEAHVRISNDGSIGLLTALGFECGEERLIGSVLVRVYRFTVSR